MVKYLSGTFKEKKQGRKKPALFSSLSILIHNHVKPPPGRSLGERHGLLHLPMPTSEWKCFWPRFKLPGGTDRGEKTVMCSDGQSIWKEILSRCGNADQQMQTLPDSELKAVRDAGRKKSTSQILLLEICVETC